MSLRSFLFRDNFSDYLINNSSVGTETVTAYCVPQIAILRIKMRPFEVPEASFQQSLLLSWRVAVSWNFKVHVPAKFRNYVFHFFLELGRGRFSVVRRCHEIMSGNDVAVKFVNRRKQGEAETLREYRHLAQLNHPHIISSLGLYLTSNSYAIVLTL